MGTTNITADAPMFIAQDLGYFKQQGIQVKFVHFKTAADAIPSVAAGQIDVAGGAMAADLFNAIDRGLNLKVVADKGQHSGSPINGFTSGVALVTSKQTASAGVFKSYADLKGKTIGLTSTCSGPEILVDKALQKAGLTLKDVNIKTLGFPSMLAALTNKSIDMAQEIEPFIALGKSKGILSVWKRSEDIYPGQEGGVLIYGPSIAKMPTVGNRFMVAYIKGIRGYYNAFGKKRQNRAQIVSILTKNTQVKTPALYDKMGWDYMNPDGYVNSKAVANDLNWYVQHGCVKTKPNLNSVIDNSYANYAVKTLGKYPG